jgi:Holliday junction resolvase RusA-like endonuclease
MRPQDYVDHVLVVRGTPVPWSKGAPPGKGPQVPARQSAHVGLIRQCWAEQHGAKQLWLEKGTPVRVIGHFYLQRPQSHYGSGMNARKLKSSEHYATAGPLLPIGKPDLSNLLKMVEDALTNLVWADDDQVVDISGSKRYVDWWLPAYSHVTVTPL